MTEDQAQQVITLIKAACGSRVDADQIDYFTARLIALDYQIGLAAASTGSIVWRRFPSWAEFFEHYKAQDHLRAPVGEQRIEEPLPKRYEIPHWVKRFIAARFLYARFGRDQDLRPFREQERYLDSATADWMPEGEWEEKAEHVSDRQVWGALGA